MVWYSLRIGSFNVKYTPLKPTPKEYPFCDSEGNILKKVLVSGSQKSFFVNEKTDEEHSTAFRLINGQARAKLSKTKEVDNYIEVEEKEVDDLIVEKTYLVDCDNLLQELNDTGKCLKFGFTFGNGFKVYKGYIHRNNLYKDFLFFSVGTTQKSEVIKELTQELKQKAKVKEIDLTIQNVNRAKVEDLIQL